MGRILHLMALEQRLKFSKHMKTGAYHNDSWNKMAISGENHRDPVKRGLRSTRKKTPHEWFELQDSCAYYEEFLKPKILYSEIVTSPQFYFDEHYFYPEASCFMLTGSNLKYLTGIFNSKIFTHLFKRYYAGGGLALV